MSTAQRAQLKGAIVMTQPIMTNFIRKDRPQPSDPDYVPMSAAYATSVGQRGNGRGAAAGGAETPQQRNQRVAEILKAAGAGVILKPSQGEHGTVFVTGRDGGPGATPSITMSGEHYNMIAGYLQQNIPVKLRVNVQSKFYDEDGGNAYNVIAELPGTDPVLKDEVVMIGGHLDSWHTGVGATDNADGIDDRDGGDADPEGDRRAPRRTIRVALWGGEEQGLLGSKAWVTEHLAGEKNAAAREKFDVYYNIDNGTGQDLRLVPPEPGRGAADLRQLAGAAEEHRRAAQRQRAGRLDRPSQLHRRRRSRIQSDPGLRQLRHPDAPHQHGYGGSSERGRHPPGGDRHGDVGLQVRQSRSQAAATGAAEVGRRPADSVARLFQAASPLCGAALSGPRLSVVAA